MKTTAADLVFRLADLYIVFSPRKGRGVYTYCDIPAGTVVEVAPVIVLTKQDRQLLHQTELRNYYFCWPENNGSQCCIALGYVSLYNHSHEANCLHTKQQECRTMTITTRTFLHAGDELTINYNGAWDDQAPLWFDVE